MITDDNLEKKYASIEVLKKIMGCSEEQALEAIDSITAIYGYPSFQPESSCAITIKQIKRPSLRQIALRYALEGIEITKENSSDFAVKNGFSPGISLYNRSRDYATSVDRTGDPESPKRMKNKINLYKSVVEFLSEEKTGNALNELKILEKRYKENYL